MTCFSFLFALFSVTALLVGEKLPPEAELDVSPTYCISFFHVLILNHLDCVLAFLLVWIIIITNNLIIFSQNDPFKLKTGGIVDMKKVKDRNRDM